MKGCIKVPSSKIVFVNILWQSHAPFAPQFWQADIVRFTGFCAFLMIFLSGRFVTPVCFNHERMIDQILSIVCLINQTKWLIYAINPDFEAI